LSHTGPPLECPPTGLFPPSSAVRSRCRSERTFLEFFLLFVMFSGPKFMRFLDVLEVKRRSHSAMHGIFFSDVCCRKTCSCPDENLLYNWMFIKTPHSLAVIFRDLFFPVACILSQRVGERGVIREERERRPKDSPKLFSFCYWSDSKQFSRCSLRSSLFRRHDRVFPGDRNAFISAVERRGSSPSPYFPSADGEIPEFPKLSSSDVFPIFALQATPPSGNGKGDWR